MTKKIMRYMILALLALMLVLIVCFFYIAVSDSASAKADYKMLLGDVDYNVMYCGRNNKTYMSFFSGYRGSPTVGSDFAYGTGYFRGKQLPTSYVELNGVSKSMYTTSIPFLDENEEYYVFMISFDFLGNSNLGNSQIAGKNYTRLGYLQLRDRSWYDMLWGIELYKDANGDIFLREAISNQMTIINDFVGGEGEFINVTVAVPLSYFHGHDIYFDTRMVFALNYYGSFGTDNNQLSNQAFMDTYVFQSLSQNLYEFDNMFAGYDDVFSETLQDAVKDSYNKGYNSGYKEGYSVGALDTDSISSFTWLKSLFGSVTSLFNIKLFGGVTIATIVSIPLILGIIMFILKLVRG